MSAALFLALLAVLIWAYLLFGHGFFWRVQPETLPAPPAQWPSVVAVVPARDEAASIAAAMESLLAQDYPGSFSVVLVDDHSGDGTADIARQAAAKAGTPEERLRIVSAPPLEPGWAGKLAAMAEGVRAANAAGAPELYLFTDADIKHHHSNVTRLVTRLEGRGCDLVSLMVRLNCKSRAERFMIPAFVFFFAMLYPFAWANDPARRTAAAAGGCMLLRRSAYERIGGLASIKGELIDDCALARAVKREGRRIWIGLSTTTHSLRAYPRLADIWNMIARTAYTQLDYSPARLAGTVLGLGITFLAPPLLLFTGAAPWLGLLAWAMMSAAYAPILRFYGLGRWRAPLLPLVALVYLAATIDSAWRHRRGKGGLWKGRVSWHSRR